MKYYKKEIMYTLLIALVVFITWNVGAYRDIEYTKGLAPKFIEDRGYTITSYDGYQGGLIGGGLVWYQARDSNGLLYEMAVTEWRGELHLYNVSCLNAITND